MARSSTSTADRFSAVEGAPLARPVAESYTGLMKQEQTDCITVEYLELFCQNNRLVVGCRGEEDEELWISSLGPHPSDLTARQVRQILRESAVFELRAMADQDGDPAEVIPVVVSRNELQQRLKRLLN